MKIKVEVPQLAGVEDALTQMNSFLIHERVKPADLEERIAELEVKMKKLWDLLTEKSITGHEKLSKSGKRIVFGLGGVKP